MGARASAALLASLMLFDPGCHKDRNPSTMSDDPGQQPPGPANVSGSAKLAGEIKKAAAGQSHGLVFQYQRGHEMSGIVSFRVDKDGGYELSRTARKSTGPLTFSGKLEAAQSQALYGALARASILEIPRSTRPIGDDEQPITLRLTDGQVTFDLTIWAKDAAENAHVTDFTSTLYPLIDQLSQGQIQLRP